MIDQHFSRPGRTLVHEGHQLVPSGMAGDAVERVRLHLHFDDLRVHCGAHVDFLLPALDSPAQRTFALIAGEHERVLRVIREHLEVFNGWPADHHSGCREDDAGAGLFNDLLPLLLRANLLEDRAQEGILVFVENLPAD